MGDWYGTAALILAIVLFVAGVRLWENRAAWTNPSPTPPPAAEPIESEEVSTLTPPADARQGRGPAPAVHMSPTGVKGVWIRPGDDDDD